MGLGRMQTEIKNSEIMCLDNTFKIVWICAEKHAYDTSTTVEKVQSKGTGMEKYGSGNMVLVIFTYLQIHLLTGL